MANAATNDAKESIHIEVIGSQWVWSFKYLDQEVESDKLILPLNRPVEFEVISDDVNHSFWPVQLGVKVDANRLQKTYARTVPTKLGNFDVKCAELCGLYHAYMETQGKVISEDDFKNWAVENGGHNK